MVGTSQPQYLIVAAKTAAGIMMSVALRGYTIWLINIVLCIYFFTQTFKISDYNRIKAAISNPAFVSPDGTMRKKVPHQTTSPYTEKCVFEPHHFLSFFFLFDMCFFKSKNNFSLFSIFLFTEMING